MINASNMVSQILTDENVSQPDSDVGEKELLSLVRCMSALPKTYPGHLNTALQLWLREQLVGDAVTFVNPRACCMS